MVIVGSWEDLEKAVKRKPTRRQTALGERVRRMVSGLAAKKAGREGEKEEAAKGEEVSDGRPACRGGRKEDTAKEEDVEEKAGANVLDAPVTPGKLSSMFEDSMRDWGSQEEVLAEVFKEEEVRPREVREAFKEGSPGKRRAPAQAVLAPKAGRGVSQSLFKRPAMDSPATYKSHCISQVVIAVLL